MRPLGLATCLGLLLIGLVFVATSIPGSPAIETSAHLPNDWAYRWGDSPVNESGVRQWTREEAPTATAQLQRDGLAAATSAWRPIAFPANPPNRQGREKVWFRATLPVGQWLDPVLYITSIDLIAQVYVGDRLVYQHGDFQTPGEIVFAGWPWHLIPLPDGFAGQRLYVRVFSDYTSIGLWGEVSVMERSEALSRIIQRSAWDVAVSALALALALFAAIFAITGVERRGFGAIALFAGASGLMLLAELPARQLIVDDALAWDVLRAFSYYMLPVAIGLILAYWLEGRARRWMTWLWSLHLLYVVTVMGLVQAGMLSLSLTFPIFDGLLMISLPIMLTLALCQWRRLDHTQRTVVLSFAVFSPLLLADILVAHAFLPWQSIPLSYGALAFSLACVSISLYRYHQVHRQLARANETLEQKVASRTAALGRLVNELERLSFRDALTGLYNRRQFDLVFERCCRESAVCHQPFTLLILDIDHFKRINDDFGHDAGDSVLVQVATTLQAHFRDQGTVCRLGGEEFVVLLPGESPQGAKARLDALLATLASTPLYYRDRALGCVTLSGGIASYPDHSRAPGELIILADRALYRAKHQGRNRGVIARANEAATADRVSVQGQ
ncbi:diguanylate cyclase [Salinicola avicenniae]|uniref:diguanylate cyclase n=1 Tax=Salinicola avicenniae TaxID=2916836 RepID=UPI002073927B|nr:MULTISPECIES: diguanylate cyclase [unclassified Salinicola]